MSTPQDSIFEKRASGILLHISSLPSKFGIGDLGPQARAFVDFLQSARQHYWQILPLNPTDSISAHSPYSSVSAFACNQLFISPVDLVADGLLDEADIRTDEFNDGLVDYKKAIVFKKEILAKAFLNFKKVGDPQVFASFKTQNAHWLDNYALYMSINWTQNEKMWIDWDEPLKNRDPEALDRFRKEHGDQIERITFYQYLFFKQWFALRAYCQKRDVKIIGDIPIYVQLDSADVWENRELFKLGKDGRPAVVAGVPPDAFSATGQRWGNPVYNWDLMKEEKFDWWMKRIRHNLTLFNLARVDHFRGLINYWEIPADEISAVKGRWVDVPYRDFFKTLKKNFAQAAIIAEDLGMITDEVKEAMHAQGFPGMKILQFAFSEDLKKHPYLPHNYDENCVVYTGTHDNNTTRGWWAHEATAHEKDNVKNYTGSSALDEEIHLKLIELASQSPAMAAIVPIQDILGLGEEDRMNRPGTTTGNWIWRLKPGMLNSCVAERLALLAESSNRF